MVRPIIHDWTSLIAPWLCNSQRSARGIRLILFKFFCALSRISNRTRRYGKLLRRHLTLHLMCLCQSNKHLMGMGNDKSCHIDSTKWKAEHIARIIFNDIAQLARATCRSAFYFMQISDFYPSWINICLSCRFSLLAQILTVAAAAGRKHSGDTLSLTEDALTEN